ncbi:aminotransferase class I/II-fold pyridoxal phosphate-dependent enzyme [Candidatus Woesearchaeota archaeon]|nr:aminotransferase class I/II-fold pyridoxal phosphate-dependent enzyme [Candidatus Woesearchaeota archaeon]
MALNPQAEELNNAIQQVNPVVLNLLSEKGKAIFFPKKGILAQTADAKGKKINATIGAALEEDGSPMRLACIAGQIKGIEPKDAFPYAPSFGKPELRKKWQEMIIQKNPNLAGKKMSLPVVTCALTHGISMCGYMFADPGDNIISPDLYWGNYRLTLQSAYGAKIDTFKTFTDENAFNVDGLKEKLAEDGAKKILLLNFPNNPTGYTPTEKEAEEIISAIRDAADSGKEIVVLCDDAYFGLVYQDGIRKTSLFEELSDLSENILAVKIDGATKEDYVWGFRVGFITFAVKNGTDGLYEALAAKVAGAIRGNISNDSHLSQSIVLNGFSDPDYLKQKEEKFAIMQGRYDLVKKTLEDNDYSSEFEALPYNSGYFMCIRLKKDAEKVRQILLEKYSTGVIALDDLLRIAFSAVKTEDIPELFENIYKACQEA